MTKVSAVVLAYLAESWLERCVHALLGSVGVEVEVILVDNGCTDGAVDRLDGTPGLTVLRPGSNLGFAGGCNAGVQASSGRLIALVNGDAIVAPDAMARLAVVAAEPDVGLCSGSIRLSEAPERINGAGNDVHFLGVSWAGGFDEPATKHASRREVAAANGSGCMLRRQVWDELGGFWEEYFAYYEDIELSLRCWQSGLRVVYVADAVIVHRYEFSRNPTKYYLAERNRLILVLTVFEARTLVLLAVPLMALEIAVFAAAIYGGWWRAKASGWAWLLRNKAAVSQRRGVLQTDRRAPDRLLAALFVDRLNPGNFPLPDFLRPLDAALALYWRLVKRAL